VDDLEQLAVQLKRAGATREVAEGVLTRFNASGEWPEGIPRPAEKPYDPRKLKTMRPAESGPEGATLSLAPTPGRGSQIASALASVPGMLKDTALNAPGEMLSHPAQAMRQIGRKATLDGRIVDQPMGGMAGFEYDAGHEERIREALKATEAEDTEKAPYSGNVGSMISPVNFVPGGTAVQAGIAAGTAAIEGGDPLNAAIQAAALSKVLGGGARLAGKGLGAAGDAVTAWQRRRNPDVAALAEHGLAPSVVPGKPVVPISPEGEAYAGRIQEAVGDLREAKADNTIRHEHLANVGAQEVLGDIQGNVARAGEYVGDVKTRHGYGHKDPAVESLVERLAEQRGVPLEGGQLTNATRLLAVIRDLKPKATDDITTKWLEQKEAEILAGAGVQDPATGAAQVRAPMSPQDVRAVGMRSWNVESPLGAPESLDVLDPRSYNDARVPATPPKPAFVPTGKRAETQSAQPQTEYMLSNRAVNKLRDEARSRVPYKSGQGLPKEAIPEHAFAETASDALRETAPQISAANQAYSKVRGHAEELLRRMGIQSDAAIDKILRGDITPYDAKGLGGMIARYGQKGGGQELQTVEFFRSINPKYRDAIDMARVELATQRQQLGEHNPNNFRISVDGTPRLNSFAFMKDLGTVARRATASAARQASNLGGLAKGASEMAELGRGRRAAGREFQRVTGTGNPAERAIEAGADIYAAAEGRLPGSRLGLALSHPLVEAKRRKKKSQEKANERND